MKILHTADWHLGIKTEGRDRTEEQRKVINEIATIAKKENVDIVIISGDIFQHAVPTSNAEDLYFDAIEQFSDDNKRIVVVLAGNHDDPKRLGASKNLAQKHNVIIASGIDEYKTLDLGAGISIASAGRGWIEVKKGDDSCVVAILPFPIEYRLGIKSEAESYPLQVKEWASICTSGFKKNAFNVFASHLMLAGTTYDKNNGIYFKSKVGDAMTVDKACLPKADYYAIGHVHSAQFIGKGDNAYYPGTILQLDYHHTETSVAIVEGYAGGIKSFKTVTIKSANNLVRIKVANIKEAETALEKYSNEDLVDIVFVQNESLSASEIKELRSKFPCIVKVELELASTPIDNEEYLVNRKTMSKKDLFESFYKRKKGIEPKPELTTLFLELMEDKTSETN